MTTEPATVAAKARKIDKVANGVAKSADREIGAWADRAEAAAKPPRPPHVTRCVKSH